MLSSGRATTRTPRPRVSVQCLPVTAPAHCFRRDHLPTCLGTTIYLSNFKMKRLNALGSKLKSLPLLQEHLPRFVSDSHSEARSREAAQRPARASLLQRACLRAHRSPLANGGIGPPPLLQVSVMKDPLAQHPRSLGLIPTCNPPTTSGTEDAVFYLLYCLWRQEAESPWTYKSPGPASGPGRCGPCWVLANLRIHM